MGRNLIFLTLLFAALTLVPSLAHVFQMEQKMSLGPDSYRIAQVVYRGWDKLGLLLILAAVFSLVYWLRLRRAQEYAMPVGIAFFCYILSLAVFFLFTLPVNIKTNNWLNFPPSWDQLRQQWEYSHAVAALLELIAFILIAWTIVYRPKK